MGMWKRVGGLVVCAVALLVTGCTAAFAPVTEPTRATQSPAVPAPLTASVAPAADSGPCSMAAAPLPVVDPTQAEQLGGATLAIPADRGSMPHAEGETIVDAAGVPVAYIVAENDVFSTVGARLCVGERWLRWVNHVRRDDDALYVGDTLNLDAHTIFSVGDQNGTVSHNEFPEGFVLPPQR